MKTTTTMWNTRSIFWNKSRKPFIHWFCDSLYFFIWRTQLCIQKRIPKFNWQILSRQNTPQDVRQVKASHFIKRFSLKTNSLTSIFIFFVECDGPLECGKIIYFSAHIARLTGNEILPAARSGHRWLNPFSLLVRRLTEHSWQIKNRTSKKRMKASYTVNGYLSCCIRIYAISIYAANAVTTPSLGGGLPKLMVNV